MIKINRIELFVFWCAILLQSLVWSRFLLSVSLWAIVIIALFEIPEQKRQDKTLFEWIGNYLKFWDWKRATNAQNSQSLQPQSLFDFGRNKSFWLFTIPFFSVILSGLWSSDYAYWLSRVQLRLPFLILPFVFSHIPPLSKRLVYILLYFFLIVISINLFLVLGNYGLNTAQIIEKLGQGVAMPFLKGHITFSVMAAFAVFISLELCLSSFFIKYKWERNIVAILGLFIFISLHIIAVRTGLIGLYIGLILRGIIFVFQSRRYIVGITGLCVVASLPLLSYQFVPSLRARINYAIWDFEQYQSGDPSLKSDSERIVSLNIGSQIFLKNKLLGVGYGDIEQEMKRYYEQDFPKLDPKLPHNQWLLTGMGMGILGFCLSFISFVFPLIEKKRYRNFIFTSLHILIFIYCMTDIPFEGTFSLSFYAFFVCLFLNYDKNY